MMTQFIDAYMRHLALIGYCPDEVLVYACARLYCINSLRPNDAYIHK